MTQYGWSKKGFKSYAEQSGFRTQRLNIIAGYKRNSNEIIAPFEYHGYTDTNLFNNWFEEQLLPSLDTGNTVVLDNASFHKDPALQLIAEEHGVEIIYLPPYSPDLNPIEKFWANLKRNIRKVIKNSENLQDATTQAFKLTLSC